MSSYRVQVREIKKDVKKVLPENIAKPFETLFIDRVDSMQGQEKNYIIYSLDKVSIVARALDAKLNPIIFLLLLGPCRA